MSLSIAPWVFGLSLSAAGWAKLGIPAAASPNVGSSTPMMRRALLEPARQLTAGNARIDVENARTASVFRWIQARTTLSRPLTRLEIGRVEAATSNFEPR